MRNGFRAGVIPGGMIVLADAAAHTGGQGLGEIQAPGDGRNRQACRRKKPVSVQIVSFPDTQWQPVRIIWGGTPAKDETAGAEPAEKAETAEIVKFADPNSGPVRVVRGETDHPTPTLPPGANGLKSQLVTFADPGVRPVTVLRGSIAQSLPGIDLFRSASESDLDRIAFAVTEPSRATAPICGCGVPSRMGRRDRCRSLPPRRSISAGATGSTWRKTGSWGAPTWLACTGATAIGRMRSQRTTGVPAIWMRGSAVGGLLPVSRSRSSAIATAYCTTPGLTKHPGTAVLRHPAGPGARFAERSAISVGRSLNRHRPPSG